jgi:Ca2+-binding EF-hand superfamily protein
MHTLLDCSVFRHFDSDNSGTIEGHELANALRQFGYNLSPQLINLIATKYCELPELLPSCAL